MKLRELREVVRVLPDRLDDLPVLVNDGDIWVTPYRLQIDDDRIVMFTEPFG